MRYYLFLINFPVVSTSRHLDMIHFCFKNTEKHKTFLNEVIYNKVYLYIVNNLYNLIHIKI